MIDYYRAVAPVLLPHLRDRPLTLARFPTGVHEKGWYQTNCRGQPDWMRVAEVPGRHGATFRMCLVDDLDALLWVANQGTIELHPLLSSAHRPQTPVELVFDFDPGPPAGLIECCRVALAVRDILEADGLAGRPKTSGSVGLHVIVALEGMERLRDFAATRAYGRGVAARLVEEQPALVTDAIALAGRRGKVLIDWRQNEPLRSMVAPYSLRATPWPLVSTPLEWDEVERAAATGDARGLVFTPADALERIERFGDLFAAGVV